ncbi:hypothetical protein GCM10010313_81090 [Streptomyces violarus]|uniref:Uncharacterized protein n=1 Tax=Streptomyces violarus TaxID=67380 RepID=A0A7W5F5K8_9ACTN|nr:MULTISPECIES: hypothetical protein [Streptomyces]MBB3080836.1 hypothetical protein [Streptomyces violarus]WRU03784.1 hypothetical protein VJ737_00055 [Streptomyces sp. CGMCC 4.1772]GHD34453.1 hypothetical protein GCM10010313_81090 [Streptomyces violarus]
MGEPAELERPDQPFSGQAKFVGLDNYRALLTQDGLDRTLFATSLRNNLCLRGDGVHHAMLGIARLHNLARVG